jgi:cytochrome c-type biogenesis protein CcmH/NrfG
VTTTGFTDAALLDLLSDYDVFRLAEDRFAERRYYDAVGLLERLVDSGVADAQVRELLARSYFHAAMIGKAEAAARSLLDEDPADGYAALLLGRSLERQSRADEAARYLARARVLGAA